MSKQLNNEDAEILKTQRRVLYILKTQMTIPAQADSDDAYAWMITRHIHKNFVLKDQPQRSQSELIDFVQDPETIKAAVEGSMDKRLAAHPTPNTVDEKLREFRLGDGSPLNDDEVTRIIQLIAAHTAKAVAEARIDELTLLRENTNLMCGCRAWSYDRINHLKEQQGGL